MWRALANTKTHFKSKTSENNHNIRYPNIAPPLDEKISSPVPIVSEAMTAPGPKIENHAKGFRDIKDDGTGGSLPDRPLSPAVHSESLIPRTFRTLKKSTMPSALGWDRDSSWNRQGAMGINRDNGKARRGSKNSQFGTHPFRGMNSLLPEWLLQPAVKRVATNNKINETLIITG